MSLDLGSLVCGFLLGVATYQFAAGTALIRRGTFSTPKAWTNPNLPARTQGKGLLLCGAVFALAGIGYLFSVALGAAVLVIGLLALREIERRRYRHEPPDQPEQSTTVQEPPSGGASGEGHPSGR